jgi:K+-sensing histidine kinase KdpD
MRWGANFPAFVGRVFFPAAPRGFRARYAFAVAASLVGLGIRVALQPFLGDHSPFLVFAAPVAVTAMCAGYGPALLVSGLGVLLGVWLFFPQPTFAVHPVPPGVLQASIFVATSVVVAKLGGEYRRRRWDAERTAQQLRQILAERDAALEKISVLTGLLPVCAGCKSIKDEAGNWRRMEEYLSEHSKAKFTHGMCPACMEQWYGEELRKLGVES